jgi:hypothetical protein
MQSEEQFAQWAAMFVKTCSETEAGPPPPGLAPVLYSGLTVAAVELLQAVVAGGVPAFVSANLSQIAEANGVIVGADTTPNQIIDALRAIASAAAPPDDAD